MLVKLKIQDGNRSFNDFYYSHDDLLDYLNRFKGYLNMDKGLWWTFEYEAEHLKTGNQLLLLTNDFNEIIGHVDEKKIPATFLKDDFYNLYLKSFSSKEHAEKSVKNI
ncbi:hypothetical protein LB452_08625 [Psychroflexus sp. CAK8W]|uniref:Uncharacterized protein n=1 Tax=Psychroflexus longus TaxID=2873596 RepID=A0ABS7XM79_9FLAO|nr:hypothetical protein [Psychroflexus longus]MBZ9778986.1 hypothetical protein [Psychroflexus longus]